MLYYCPLESYKERYTMQLSAPVTGWLERKWIKEGIEYKRIDPQFPQREIKTGVALDAVGRSLWCFAQNGLLLELAEDGKITSDDVIYFDDFWHPGLEALPYTFHLLGIKPKMYATIWAQSVDEFDFTHPMRHWMRPFEVGIAAALDGIFVGATVLQDLVVWGGIAPREKVHVIGHVFCSEEVLERMPKFNPRVFDTTGARENKVVFSSRWDTEKNPAFFLAVVEEVVARFPVAKFVLCTSAKELRSNDPAFLIMARHLAHLYSNNFRILENLSKEQYYHELCTAKVQINTADQDFVSYTLLEASVAGCYPIYPYFRSFPEVFRYGADYTYNRLDLEDCVNKVISVLQRDDLWTPDQCNNRAWIHTRFDNTWQRMLQHMGLMIVPLPPLVPDQEATKALHDRGGSGTVLKEAHAQKGIGNPYAPFTL